MVRHSEHDRLHYASVLKRPAANASGVLKRPAAAVAAADEPRLTAKLLQDEHGALATTTSLCLPLCVSASQCTIEKDSAHRCIHGYCEDLVAEV